jgi:uncharacterized protein (TIGR00730 family)
MLRRICVYCGSRSGLRSEYVEQARELGRLLVERDLELVFGGGSIGLMGIVADSVLAAGGRAIGVIPQFLSRKEILHQSLTETRIVSSMHERKAQMEKLSDAFIALPGGLGTFEELFEILTWSQLGLHRKNVGLLNIRGFFDPFEMLLRNAIEEGFVKPEYHELVVLANDPHELLDTLESHRLPEVPRWLYDEEEA